LKEYEAVLATVVVQEWRCVWGRDAIALIDSLEVIGESNEKA
jgi:GH15 family glucan-1,4-alpha-glucosidase